MYGQGPSARELRRLQHLNFQSCSVVLLILVSYVSNGTSKITLDQGVMIRQGNISELNADYIVEPGSRTFCENNVWAMGGSFIETILRLFRNGQCIQEFRCLRAENSHGSIYRRMSNSNGFGRGYSETDSVVPINISETSSWLLSVVGVSHGISGPLLLILTTIMSPALLVAPNPTFSG
ncbi:hypothetical protein FB45DRAFT_1109997 [Roridomyces roridus]|uniref:Uncharacterized protein n=1 Tax=Roridomyces roridus TaxID=1738132 RepID=A0AAD7FDS1_9AGAR|nr:hypothetical protein FB45DRAFT_1109997 [Roridomyces roridus]